MNETHFPALPDKDTTGPQACESVRFYLAIIDDLPLEQVQIINEHLQQCPECAVEFHLLRAVTNQVASLPVSVPSARVDEAILAALHKGGRISSVQLYTKGSLKPGTRTRRRSGMLTLVAALFILLLLLGIFLRWVIFPASPTQTFELPANLSWNGYVAHYTQNNVDGLGKSYQIEVYQDLGTDQMHIESTLPGQFDVVVVTDSQTMLGEDMMHHIAQTGNGVMGWTVDGSLLNLNVLRQDLKAGNVTYLGQETYQGQKAYLVRNSDDQVLVLNLHYLPLNILSGYTNPGTGKPLYTSFTLMQSAEVSDTMWDMQVPSGFQMGQLPTRS